MYLKSIIINICALVVIVLLIPFAVYAQPENTKAVPLERTVQEKSAFLAEGYNNQGLKYVKQHFYELGRQAFLQAIALAETQDKVNLYSNNLAMANKDLGNNAEALQIIDKVLENDANLAEALDTKGEILINMGRYDTAVIVLTKAISLQPSDGTFYYTRGRAREGLRQLNLAKNDYKKASELSGNYQKEAKAKLRTLH